MPVTAYIGRNIRIYSVAAADLYLYDGASLMDVLPASLGVDLVYIGNAAWFNLLDQTSSLISQPSFN